MPEQFTSYQQISRWEKASLYFEDKAWITFKYKVGLKGEEGKQSPYHKEQTGISYRAEDKQNAYLYQLLQNSCQCQILH